MNVRIKFRESFRPFAPSVLREDVNEYFDLNEDSPYMLIVTPVQKSIRTQLSDEEQEQMKNPNLIQRVNVKRSTVPAVTHVDMSARYNRG